MTPYLDLAYQQRVFRERVAALRADRLAGIDPRLHDRRSWIICGTAMANERAWLLANVDVLAYVDDYRVGQQLDGRPVISTQQWIRLAPDVASAILVETERGYDHFYRVAQCFDLPCASPLDLERLLAAPLRTHHNKTYLEDVVAHAEELERVAQRFAEPFSRLTMYAALNFRLTRDPHFLASVAGGREPAYRFEDSERTDDEVFGYFAYQLERRFIRLGADEVLVDAGAFDGVSMLHLVRATSGRFRRLDAFEPGPAFHASCRAAVARLAAEYGADLAERIRVHPCGLWSEPATLEFQGDFFGDAAMRDAHWSPMGAHLVAANVSGTAAAASSKVPVVTIDDTCPDATYIKLEIEGSELRALEGARQTLARQRPQLSIAAYHKPEDLRTLPDFIAELDLGYELGLRHHHRSSFISTVLYAAR